VFGIVHENYFAIFAETSGVDFASHWTEIQGQAKSMPRSKSNASYTDSSI